MSLLVKILIAAVLIGGFAIAITSFFVLLHSVGKLISTAYEPETSKTKKVLFQLLPFLSVTPLLQPPEKRKYTNRFAYSLVTFLVCFGVLAFLKEYMENLE